MSVLQIDPKIVNQLIQSGRINELIGQIEGIDPNLANRLQSETKKLLETPVEQFKNLQGAGGSVMQGMWIALWQGLWTVIEPMLPALYNYFGQLDAVKQLATQKSFKELRPTPNDIGTVIRFLHRYPDEREEALENLALQGYSSERIRQIILAGREVLQDNEIRELWKRGYFTGEEASSALQRLGYYEDEAKTLQQTWTTLLDAGAIRDLFLRGEITIEDAVQRLSALGFNKADVEHITKLFYFIPSAQDLITMSVREVFSPEVAARFGQYEDFPEEFERFAAMQGISKEWAERYWAAHWDLPSIGMGFEMFHREVIDYDDLNLLLKAKDVMPFWRDKLLQISYNPLTRVDVRRMHAMGVLDRNAVLKSYKDIGYNAQDAELMTQFTVAYNSRSERDLSKSEILNSYIEGIINQREAIQLLYDMGYDDRETAIILTLAEIKQADKLKKAKLKVIKNKYVNHLITKSELYQELGKLNLTGKEQELVIEEFTIALEDKTETISLKDLRVAFKRNVIKEDEFRERLSNLGYIKKDIELLIKIVKAGG